YHRRSVRELRLRRPPSRPFSTRLHLLLPRALFLELFPPAATLPRHLELQARPAHSAEVWLRRRIRSVKKLRKLPLQYRNSFSSLFLPIEQLHRFQRLGDR